MKQTRDLIDANLWFVSLLFARGRHC